MPILNQSTLMELFLKLFYFTPIYKITSALAKYTQFPVLFNTLVLMSFQLEVYFCIFERERIFAIWIFTVLLCFRSTVLFLHEQRKITQRQFCLKQDQRIERCGRLWKDKRTFNLCLGQKKENAMYILDRKKYLMPMTFFWTAHQQFFMHYICRFLKLISNCIYLKSQEINEDLYEQEPFWNVFL